MLIFFNLLRTKYKVRLYRFKYINGFPPKKKKKYINGGLYTYVYNFDERSYTYMYN
jgi:hypothetical protein